MRRVVLLTTICLVSLVAAAGCNDDGRTLRPPTSRQNSSISVTSAPATTTDDPSFIDPDDPTLTADPSDTIPVSDAPLEAIAPWRDGQAIDPRYTCDDLNIAPALSWSPAPAGTVEIAITLKDLDAPDFVHWVLAGLAPDAIALNEDTVPIGAYEANNGLGDLGYTGPCPPAGGPHTYVVTVHYLGAATGLDDGVEGSDLMLAISAAETAFAEVSGTFSRS